MFFNIFCEAANNRPYPISQPGGVDFKAAEKLGLQARWALSLPGKVAPESAAQYLRDTLMVILRERDVML